MDTPSVKTIDRLVNILDYFAHGASSVSLAELSAHLNLPKSTLHRFLVGLEAHGILRRDEGDKRWQLGYHLIAWGGAAADRSNLRATAGHILRGLVERTGETAILTVYQQYRVVCLDLCETSHSVRLNIQAGSYQYAHAGASSKALTAFLPDEEVTTIIRENGLPRLSTNTITDADALRAELARIRAAGYAASLEETDPGAWGVATPVRDWRGEVVAAIGLAGPTLRYSQDLEECYARYCREAAAQITSRLSIGIPAR